jgi:hypothetical protein
MITAVWLALGTGTKTVNKAVMQQGRSTGMACLRSIIATQLASSVYCMESLQVTIYILQKVLAGWQCML